MIKRLSKIYWPQYVIPKDATVKQEKVTSKSQKLLLDSGLIKSTGNGTFHILPIAQRAVEKCVDLVNDHMDEIGAQRISIPILTSSSLWKKSGRLEQGLTEFFTLKDRQDRMHILSPTNEESVAALVAMSAPLSYKQLPLKLYQVGPKFRDELKPRFGLIRSKEFIMKDLYSFDSSIESLEKSYNEVNAAYEKLLNSLQLPWVKVRGSTGIMGGAVSHEYHIPSKIGEDNLLNCSKCSFASNAELYEGVSECPECGNQLNSTKGIEVGHTFILEDKYSKPLKATYLKMNGKTENLFMGCYGIGITRLVAASIEVLSTENEIRWPDSIVPYKICVIPPKEGSKEEKAGTEFLNRILPELKRIYGAGEILLDDRTHLTIGKRFMDSKKIGYSKILIIGNKVTDVNPKIELHCLKTETKKDLEFSELLEELNHNEKPNKQTLCNKL